MTYFMFKLDGIHCFQVSLTSLRDKCDFETSFQVFCFKYYKGH